MLDSVRIIVADPQPEMQRFYREMLPQMGHRVVGVVETGRELVQQCRAFRPDLVISDARLLDMDAVAAGEQILQDAAIPMIVLTARHPELLGGHWARWSMVTYLIKPVSRARLAEEIPLAIRRFEACGGMPGRGSRVGELQQDDISQP